MTEFKLLLREKRYLGMTGTIANLENKLHLAKEKKPSVDYSEQDRILEIIKDYFNNAVELEYEVEAMNKKVLDYGNRVDELKKMLRDCCSKVNVLTTENESLKEMIKPGL
ncbi:MAG: hypothetical protein ACUZ8H_15955 [Candidatus Anammoxibacter sp.]